MQIIGSELINIVGILLNYTTNHYISMCLNWKHNGFTALIYYQRKLLMTKYYDQSNLPGFFSEIIIRYKKIYMKPIAANISYLTESL